jgi:hypothetical protein
MNTPPTLENKGSPPWNPPPDKFKDMPEPQNDVLLGKNSMNNNNDDGIEKSMLID